MTVKGVRPINNDAGNRQEYKRRPMNALETDIRTEVPANDEGKTLANIILDRTNQIEHLPPIQKTDDTADHWNNLKYQRKRLPGQVNRFVI